MSMRMRAAVITAVLALGLPGVAAAVKPGGALYVKAKNTRVMDSPAPSATAVVILQPGEQVTWQGADPKHKQWHRVTAPGGKKGFVFQTNLSSTPPSMELVSDPEGKQRMNPKEFVASGAAVKALSPGAEKYGKAKQGGYAEAVASIKALEQQNKAVTEDTLAAHVKQAGLFPVVGPSDSPMKKGTKKGGSQ